MRAATELYCRVEIPKGSALDPTGDVNARPTVCPADCCYFPDTLADSGGPLEAFVVGSLATRAGATIAVRPVGLLRAGRGPSRREVVVCVPLEDPDWSAIDRVQDLPARLRGEIERLIERHSRAETTAAAVAWRPRDEALTAIDDAAARWAATTNGHG